METPDHMSSIQPPLLDQPRITAHTSNASVTQLVRLSSAGRDGSGSRQRATPESSPGIKTFTRHNITFSPVNSSKPPMPPQSLNNNRSSSGETRRPRPKLDRTQRSNVSRKLSAGKQISLSAPCLCLQGPDIHTVRGILISQASAHFFLNSR